MQCPDCHNHADDPQRDYPPLCRECGENKIRMALRKREPIPIENYRSKVDPSGLTKWVRDRNKRKVLAE